MQGLKELREAKGWTQEELAHRLGLTRNTVVLWETGKGRPRSKIILAKLKRIFGLMAQEMADLMKEAE